MPTQPTPAPAATDTAAAAVRCARCGQPLSVDARYAGLPVKCLHCGADFTVAAGTPADSPGQARRRTDADGRGEADGDEYAYLVGYTPLGDYLDFMAAEAVGEAARDRKALAERWRAADDYRRARQREQRARAERAARPAGGSDAEWFTYVRRRQGAGGDAASDGDAARGDGIHTGNGHPPAPPAPAGDWPPGAQPLPAEMAPLVARVEADPVFRRAFTAVPVRVGWVELSSLVVFQRTVNLDHVRRLQRDLGPDPSPADVFRFCLPYDHPLPAYRVRSLPGRGGGDGAYVFTSDSNDLRFLESVLLDPARAGGFNAVGPVAGVVGLAVGFGSNYLNVIAARGRLVLNNGNHRAYALRDLGLTHAPCLVQEVKRRDELSVIASGRLRRHPERYLKDPAPPTLADFFDPQLAHRVRLARKGREVRVTFRVEETSL